MVFVSTCRYMEAVSKRTNVSSRLNLTSRLKTSRAHPCHIMMFWLLNTDVCVDGTSFPNVKKTPENDPHYLA